MGGSGFGQRRLALELDGRKNLKRSLPRSQLHAEETLESRRVIEVLRDAAK